MKLHPINECMQQADQLLEHCGKSAKIYQQFTCAGCGAKQTMDVPNAFFDRGSCEECGAVTDIAANGCNYCLHIGLK